MGADVYRISDLTNIDRFTRNRQMVRFGTEGGFADSAPQSGDFRVWVNGTAMVFEQEGVYTASAGIVAGAQFGFQVDTKDGTAHGTVLMPTPSLSVISPPKDSVVSNSQSLSVTWAEVASDSARISVFAADEDNQPTSLLYSGATSSDSTFVIPTAQMSLLPPGPVVLMVAVISSGSLESDGQVRFGNGSYVEAADVDIRPITIAIGASTMAAPAAQPSPDQSSWRYLFSTADGE